MTKRVLIMGLPGSGKTDLASDLVALLDPSTTLWLNGDKIRAKYCDWDFSHEGRIRQARRLRALADGSCDGIAVIDFVCPLKEMRDIIKPDVLIWMNTIEAGRYADTNAMFEPPDMYDFHINSFDDIAVRAIMAAIEHA